MFNETRILQNTVCNWDGQRVAYMDLLLLLDRTGRKTVKREELERAFHDTDQKYRKAWNEWADKAKIGGRRYEIEEEA